MGTIRLIGDRLYYNHFQSKMSICTFLEGHYLGSHFLSSCELKKIDMRFIKAYSHAGLLLSLAVLTFLLTGCCELFPESCCEENCQVDCSECKPIDQDSIRMVYNPYREDSTMLRFAKAKASDTIGVMTFSGTTTCEGTCPDDPFCTPLLAGLGTGVIKYDESSKVMWIEGLRPLVNCNDIGTPECYRGVPQYLVLWNFGDGHIRRAQYVFEPGVSYDMNKYISVGYEYGLENPGNSFSTSKGKTSVTITAIYAHVGRPSLRINNESGTVTECLGCYSAPPTRFGGDPAGEIFLNRFGGEVRSVITECEHRVNGNDSLVFAYRDSNDITPVYRVVFPIVDENPIIRSSLTPTVTAYNDGIPISEDRIEWLETPGMEEIKYWELFVNFDGLTGNYERAVFVEFTSNSMAEISLLPFTVYKQTTAGTIQSQTTKTWRSGPSIDPNYIQVCPSCKVLAEAGQQIDFKIGFLNSSTNDVLQEIKVMVDLNDATLLDLSSRASSLNVDILPLTANIGGNTNIGSAFFIKPEFLPPNRLLFSIFTPSEAVEEEQILLKGAKYGEHGPNKGEFQFRVFTSSQFNIGDTIVASGAVKFKNALAPEIFPQPAAVIAADETRRGNCGF